MRDKQLVELEGLVVTTQELVGRCTAALRTAVMLCDQRRAQLYVEELAALGAVDPDEEGLVPGKTELPRRGGPGGRRGGGLGRAAAAFLGKDRPPPPRPTRGLPSKRLGKGLGEILKQPPPPEKGSILPTSTPAPRPRPRHFENSEPAAEDWTPVPPGEGRRVELDGGGAFEAAGEW